MQRFTMERLNIFVCVALSLFVFSSVCGGIGLAKAETNEDGTEEWGYVEVRPKANMFWWLHKSPNKVDDPNKSWPIILWLQGGPGASGVGIGNFQEIGPLGVNLNPRNSTWLKRADLLFVDCPVGVGYSYVENTSLLVKTDEEAATDLKTLLIELFNNNTNLQKSPLYIVGQSYGGKFAVSLGLSALNAIAAGELKLKLGGVILGDSWISPEDFVFSWGPLLKDVSRIDDNGLEKSNSLATQIKKKLDDGLFTEATALWGTLQDNFYNFMLDSNMDPLLSTSSALNTLMNGAIKTKLKIIPGNIQWRSQSSVVFANMRGDIMKPRISEVDELLNKGVNVTIYNGQVDLICATKGTEAWVQKLKWEGLKTFTSMERRPMYCGDNQTRAFVKSYKNLHFYWILGAGHYVAVDQPCVSLNMIGEIIQSPSTLQNEDSYLHETS
ncbi:unnamed protein product [Cuscuta epithymum]|uniref:Carboxypeptidase n=1 Tax=Cuscuta epithymum TaxID=186058 RepID=A0AAV0D7T1_9ASTE|nr:unnamed protein product [Cuscuta epithymum]